MTAVEKAHPDCGGVMQYNFSNGLTGSAGGRGGDH